MLPCQRQTRTQGRNRRSHDALTSRAAITCPTCGAPKLPHAACRECGYVRPGLKISRGRQSNS